MKSIKLQIKPSESHKVLYSKILENENQNQSLTLQKIENNIHQSNYDNQKMIKSFSLTQFNFLTQSGKEYINQSTFSEIRNLQMSITQSFYNNSHKQIQNHQNVLPYSLIQNQFANRENSKSNIIQPDEINVYFQDHQILINSTLSNDYNVNDNNNNTINTNRKIIDIHNEINACQSKSYEEYFQNQITSLDPHCLIDSQFSDISDAFGDIVENKNEQEKNPINQNNYQNKSISVEDLDEKQHDLSFLGTTQPPFINEQLSKNQQSLKFSNQNTNNHNLNKKSICSYDDEKKRGDSKKINISKVSLVNKTQKTIRQKQQKGEKHLFRQSQHKNVFKNFGYTLIKYILQETHFQMRLKNEFFKDNSEEIQEFQNWLTFDAKLAKKADFLRAWQTFKEESEKIKEFKYILRELARNFFENFSLIYLINTKKIQDLEIHLRSINTYLSALNNIAYLEKFKPVPLSTFD